MSDELCRRAVACRAWRWVPGMRIGGRSDQWRIISDGGHGTVRAYRDDYDPGYASIWFVASDIDLPDLTDPATIGCLLALVREAWGDPCAYVAPGDGWYVGIGARTGMCGSGPTEAAALVAALENAP